MGYYHDLLVANCVSDGGLDKILKDNEEVDNLEVEVPCGHGWADIVIETKDGKTILVEAKTEQGESIGAAIRELKRYSFYLDVDRLVVAINYGSTHDSKITSMGTFQNLNVVTIDSPRKNSKQEIVGMES